MFQCQKNNAAVTLSYSKQLTELQFQFQTFSGYSFVIELNITQYIEVTFDNNIKNFCTNFSQKHHFIAFTIYCIVQMGVIYLIIA